MNIFHYSKFLTAYRLYSEQFFCAAPGGTMSHLYLVLSSRDGCCKGRRGQPCDSLLSGQLSETQDPLYIVFRSHEP